MACENVNAGGRHKIIPLQGVCGLKKRDVFESHGRLVDVIKEIGVSEDTALSLTYSTFFRECAISKVCSDSLVSA